MNTIGSINESYLAMAIDAANSEWWKLFWCALVIAALLVAFNYYRFSRSIWVANQKGQQERAKKLGNIRHVVAGVILLCMVVFLVIGKIYKEPVSIQKEFTAYNVNLIGGAEVGEEELKEKCNITFDVIVRKRIFKADEVTGMAVVEGIEYVLPARIGSYEGENMYILTFHEDGNDGISHDLLVDVTKDFEMCVFHATKVGGDGYVAPANTEAEAADVYDKFVKLR